MKTIDLFKTAVLAALLTLFTFMSVYAPFFSILGILLGASTITVLLVSVSSPKAIGVGLVVSMVLSLLFSNVIVLLSKGYLAILIPGIAIGYCFRKKKSFYECILAGGIAYLCAMLLWFFFMKQFFGMDLVSELKEMATTGLQQMVQFLQATPELANSKQAAEFIDMIPTLTDQMVLMLPSTLLLLSLAGALGSLLFSRGVLIRMGFPYSYLPAFSGLSVPKHLAYGYFILVLVSLFTSNFSFYYLMMNVITLVSMILFLCGLSVLKYWINQTRVPKGISMILFCMALPIACFLAQFFVLLGIADLLWNFRKPRVME